MENIPETLLPVRKYFGKFSEDLYGRICPEIAESRTRRRGANKKHGPEKWSEEALKFLLFCTQLINGAQTSK